MVVRLLFSEALKGVNVQSQRCTGHRVSRCFNDVIQARGTHLRLVGCGTRHIHIRCNVQRIWVAPSVMQDTRRCTRVGSAAETTAKGTAAVNLDTDGTTFQFSGCAAHPLSSAECQMDCLIGIRFLFCAPAGGRRRSQT